MMAIQLVLLFLSGLTLTLIITSHRYQFVMHCKHVQQSWRLTSQDMAYAAVLDTHKSGHARNASQIGTGESIQEG